MIEDDIYRTSSQYRFWSYTAERLNELRQETNSLASEKVRAALKRSHLAKLQAESDNSTPDDIGDVKIQTLTTDEELKIVQWGCTKIMEMGEAMTPRIPPTIVATAIQYLRRFYLTNSPMTYHPKQIMLCALFLATKADHFYIPLSSFISELPNITEDDIKAPEFLLMQGLRFTLDVRHPMRGLEGGVSELQALADQASLKSVSKKGSRQRIGKAADVAKNLLRSAAQMTDVYFLYTPSQIWLAAMMISDKELTEDYIDQLFDRFDTSIPAMKSKLKDTLKTCVEILSSYRSPEDDSAARKEMTRIGKKLKICQNPEKIDLVALTKAKAAEKREGSGSGEKAMKKRKLERERLEKDGEVFGPDLKASMKE